MNDQGLEALETYLNDHLAGSEAALDLMDDTLEGSTDAEFVAFMRTLRQEIREDRQQLEGVMERLDVSPQRVKQALASVAAKVSRLKLLRAGEHERLSQLLELEALSAGVWAKKLLWASLDAADELAGPLAGIDFNRLIERAERQLAELEEHRVAVARTVLSR
jgi:hypothetical protein